MLHTTNYINTFIEVAEDCPIDMAEVPPQKAAVTAANIQFDMIQKHPYKYTSDDVVFQVFAVKNDVSPGELKKERETFFSKGQPCLRSSPLGKRYGWGIHSDEKGKVALYAVESEEYKKLSKDKKLEHTRAMRSKRK